MSYRTYSPCNGAIINARGNGDFQDFPTAMATAGSSWNTIYYVNEAGSTYTNQDFTMPPGVLLTSMPGSGQLGNIQVNTQITINQAGNYVISNLELVASTGFSLVISGSAAVNVVIDSCSLLSAGATCISYTNSNASSSVLLFNCTGDILNLGNSFYTNSSSGSLYLTGCNFKNTIGSTTADTSSSGITTYSDCKQFNPISATGSNQCFANNLFVDTFSLSVTSYTTSAGTIARFNYAHFRSGDAPSFTVGQVVYCTFVILGVNSGNAVTGAGTLYVGTIVNEANTDAYSVGFQTGFTSTKIGNLKIISLAEMLSGSTLQIDGGATVQVESGAVLNLQTGANIDVPLTGLLMGNGVNNPVTAVAYNPSGYPWTDVTGATQTLATNHGYVTDHTNVTYTLPATANLGDTIKIVGKLGITTIAQNANQQIDMSSGSSTVGAGGSVAGTNVGDCVELICITSGAATIWRAANWVGSWTIT